MSPRATRHNTNLSKRGGLSLNELFVRAGHRSRVQASTLPAMPGALEYVKKHRPRQLARVRVLQRGMIAGDGGQSAGQRVFGPMGKRVVAREQALRLALLVGQQAVECDACPGKRRHEDS